MEYNNILPIKQNLAKVEDLIRRNKRVVLISDMYLSEKTIRCFLLKFSDLFNDIKIYVSNEAKCGKISGELFKFVKEKEKIKYSDWKHLGDNKKSDFENAKKLGIKAELYNFQLKPYENFALAGNSTDISVQKIISCAQNTRLLSDNKFFQFGCSFAAPILIPYVHWVLEEALKNDIKCLYFIARDGYIPKEIADIIIQKKNLSIKTKYIYGSRIAWQMPTTVKTTNFIPMLIKASCHTPSKLIETLGITKNDLQKILPNRMLEDGITYSLKDKDFITNKLLEASWILTKIKKSNLEKYEIVLGYLKQEINTTQSFAFVDISGCGLTQNCLAEILNTEIDTYYLSNASLAQTPLNKKHYFSLNLKTIPYLECLSRAPHSQTISYEYTDGIYKPIFAREFKEENLLFDIEEYIKGIKEFTFYYLNSSIEVTNILVYKYSDFILKKIDLQTANLIGDINYSTSLNSKESCFAPKITKLNAIMYCLNIQKLITNNRHISYKRSSNKVKKIIDIGDKLRTFYSKMFCKK